MIDYYTIVADCDKDRYKRGYLHVRALTEGGEPVLTESTNHLFCFDEVTANRILDDLRELGYGEPFKLFENPAKHRSATKYTFQPWQHGKQQPPRQETEVAQ